MWEGIQSRNGLKARASAKKSGIAAILVTTQENTIKKPFSKTLNITLDFDFLKHPVYSCVQRRFDCKGRIESSERWFFVVEIRQWYTSFQTFFVRIQCNIWQKFQPYHQESFYKN